MKEIRGTYKKVMERRLEKGREKLAILKNVYRRKNENKKHLY